MKFYQGILFLFILSLCFFVVGCQSTEENTLEDAHKTVTLPSGNQSFENIQSQIKVSPLFIKWHYQIKNENLVKLYNVSNLVIAETTSGKLYAFESHSGVPQWVYQVGESVDYNIEEFQGEIYILALGKLHVLDANTGSLLKVKLLDFVPCSPMCVTERYIYVGAWDHFIYALNRKNLMREWRFRIDGHTHGKPSSLDGVLFFVGTDSHIYAINSESGYSNENWGKNSRFITRGSNVSNIIPQSNPARIFVGSRDYNFYSINRITGMLDWKYESGGEIKTNATFIDNKLYFSSYPIGKPVHFHALNSQTGEAEWTLEHGAKLFFVGKNHIWVVSDSQELLGMRAGLESPEHFSFNAFTIFARDTNVKNLGFLGNQNGYIVAVEEK